MALSPSVLSNLIYSNLLAIGAKGPNLQKFTTAVGTGIALSIIGKSFTTTDVGMVPGIGVGTGIGISGPQVPTMTNIAVSMLPTRGENAERLMNAIMKATVSHLGSANLISAHPIVYLGSGIVIAGSITVVESEMAHNIDSQLVSIGANGSNRTILSNAIAAGVARQIVSAGTGSVVITGSPTSPFPTQGTGAGTGTIS